MNILPKQGAIFVAVIIQATVVAHAEMPTNIQEAPPGKPGPCIRSMSNGMPCATDLLGYPIDIYRTDWSEQDRSVFWETQFTDTGKLEMVPTFPNSGIGFKKMKMPEEMYQKILDYYHSLPDTMSSHVPGFINNPNPGSGGTSQEKSAPGTGKMGMADAVVYQRDFTVTERDMILTYMSTILEEWIGGPERPVKLEYTSIYGMRIYTNGSMLMNHCDRAETHAVSAILNIMQEGIREPWPLAIMGNDGKTHEVTMKPGEMVLYESARLAHGRPHALDGDRCVANNTMQAPFVSGSVCGVCGCSSRVGSNMAVLLLLLTRGSHRVLRRAPCTPGTATDLCTCGPAAPITVIGLPQSTP